MIAAPTPALRLFKGHTIHQRSEGFMHRFRYGLVMIDVDIDRLGAADRLCALFSVDSVNLFGFRTSDHGDAQAAGLRDWADTQFEAAGVRLDGGRVRLLTFPRHLLYKFAPISLWLGFTPDGRLAGVIYEVNNTFGESHVYVAKTVQSERHQHRAEKVFHVSPFFDTSGTYSFTLRVSEARLSLMVATHKGDTQTHLATLQGCFHPVTNARLARLALTKPLSTIGVSLAIHWQALKLWIRGAVYYPKPKPIAPRISIARANDTPQAMSQESAL